MTRLNLAQFGSVWCDGDVVQLVGATRWTPLVCMTGCEGTSQLLRMKGDERACGQNEHMQGVGPKEWDPKLQGMEAVRKQSKVPAPFPPSINNLHLLLALFPYPKNRAISPMTSYGSITQHGTRLLMSGRLLIHMARTTI